ncbi:hypothetical protein ACRYI5_01270 [Furfurilactobacillus sp. WILCCON 0119]
MTEETTTTKTRATKTTKKPTELVSVFGAQDHFEVEETNKTITKYTLQFPGTEAAQRILAQAQLAGEGMIDSYTYRKALMEQVIVAPKGVDFDWFDAHAGFMTVMDRVDTFLFTKLDRSAE